MIYLKLLYNTSREFFVIQAALCCKTNTTSKFFQLAGSNIGSHDNNGIFEIYHSAITVSQTTLIHYLKQEIEHIRMCFFYFIKQDNRIWFTTHFC